MRVLFLTLLLLAGCAAQSPAPTASSTNPPAAENSIVNITIYPASVAPSAIVAGDPISMAVQLDVAATDLSLLRLSITYPSGHVQTVVESIYGDAATLSWTVPPESGSGTATYRLSSEGCGCGPDDKGATSIDQKSTSSGEFIIE